MSRYSVGESVATGEVTPKALPTSTRTVTPGSAVQGIAAAAVCWKLGIASSCSTGSAHHSCSP